MKNNKSPFGSLLFGVLSPISALTLINAALGYWVYITELGASLRNSTILTLSIILTALYLVQSYGFIKMKKWLLIVASSIFFLYLIAYYLILQGSLAFMVRPIETFFMSENSVLLYLNLITLVYVHRNKKLFVQ